MADFLDPAFSCSRAFLRSRDSFVRFAALRRFLMCLSGSGPMQVPWSLNCMLPTVRRRNRRGCSSSSRAPVKMDEPLGVAVHRWHGDVDTEAKRRIRERPSGILFITPESLESCFINYSHQAPKMFRGIECVVLDEVHALLETERGMHVRSLLTRLETAIQRRPRRFGLSATLGDPMAVRSFLNVDDRASVRVVTDRSTARPIQVAVVTVGGGAEQGALPDRAGVAECNGPTGTLELIANDIRRTFKDDTCLVFANSRRIVEELGDHFLGRCALASDGEPAVVLHHGSLSARLRRQTESMLKSGFPTRALCTSSLELGIDIGAVEAVAQIDPTWSVASMVQRLGRSGRTPGSTSQMRLYVRAPALTAQASLVHLLRPALLQAVAMVKLLLAGWLEPATADRMHLSTLVHQILSVLKETGGQTALALYQSLCPYGPGRLHRRQVLAEQSRLPPPGADTFHAKRLPGDQRQRQGCAQHLAATFTF